MVLESDIPIPPPKKGGRGVPRTELGAEIRCMKIGQSRFFTDLGERNTAKTLISQLGGKCCIRQGMHDGVSGWRLWRVA